MMGALAGTLLPCTATTYQLTPPCGNTYVSAFDRVAIELAMYSGTEQDVIDAINNAKETRGNRAGCAECIVEHTPPDFTEPSLTSITQLWETVYAPLLADVSGSEPSRPFPNGA